MALFHVLLLAAFVDGRVIEEETSPCDSCEAASTFLQVELSKEKTSTYWHPTKSVDLNRSGCARVSGPFPLHKPDWEFTRPGLNFHQVPAIDDKLNVYVTSDAGEIFSFDKHGNKRWEVEGTGKACQNPFLFEGILYTACMDGSALALNMTTGERVWQTKVSQALPYEPYTVSVTKDYVFIPAGSNPGPLYVGPFHDPIEIGSPAVALLRRLDGQLLWTFDLAGESTEELLPCMLSDSVIFAGWYGTIYRLSLESGSVIWRSRPFGPLNIITVAQVSCTQDGKVLVGFGDNGLASPVGGIQAIDIETGEKLWTISVPYGVYTPIAVGNIKGHAGTAIIVPMGVPATTYPNFTTTNHSLWAVDANTGS